MARAKKENIPVCKYNTSIDCRQMEEPSTVERQCEHCGWNWRAIRAGELPPWKEETKG